jgi:tellurite resistance protein TerC
VEVDLWVWAAFGAFVVLLLALDLFVLHRDAHEIETREAAVLTAIWVSISLAFGGLLWWWQGGTVAAQYLTGYVVEWSLSLDNVFVFALIFSYFAVPKELRYRVLFWGVVLAIALRGVFIVVGASLLETFAWVAYLFGLFLVVTGIKVARHTSIEIHPERNPALRLLRRLVPVTQDYRGTRLLVRENGRRAATPLFAAFVLVASFDLVFAVDSIPAIFAVTDDPFIVFTSNIFAILGLRALYFVLSGYLSGLAYLKPALAAILVFVGTKMVVADVYKIDPVVSLLVIAFILVGAIVASLLVQREGGGVPLPGTQSAERRRLPRSGTTSEP